MASIRSGSWWRLLALAIYAALLAGTFLVGFELGKSYLGVQVGPQPCVPSNPAGLTPDAVAGLNDEISALRQQGVVLERTRQIEQETNRSLQDQLKQVQGERLALAKETSYLKRLVQEGGKGAVRVHDLRLTPGDGARAVRYAFTVTQLIPGFGETKGSVRLKVSGDQQEQGRSYDLQQLPGADPAHLTMGFEHFQTFQGGFRLPEGFVPRFIVVTLVPEGDQLAETSETFPWALDVP